MRNRTLKWVLWMATEVLVAGPSYALDEVARFDAMARSGAEYAIVLDASTQIDVRDTVQIHQRSRIGPVLLRWDPVNTQFVGEGKLERVATDWDFLDPNAPKGCSSARGATGTESDPENRVSFAIRAAHDDKSAKIIEDLLATRDAITKRELDGAGITAEDRRARDDLRRQVERLQVSNLTATLELRPLMGFVDCGPFPAFYDHQGAIAFAMFSALSAAPEGGAPPRTVWGFLEGNAPKYPLENWRPAVDPARSFRLAKLTMVGGPTNWVRGGSGQQFVSGRVDMTIYHVEQPRDEDKCSESASDRSCMARYFQLNEICGQGRENVQSCVSLRGGTFQCGISSSRPPGLAPVLTVNQGWDQACSNKRPSASACQLECYAW